MGDRERRVRSCRLAPGLRSHDPVAGLAMDNPWFPFFSMLFWWATKLVGLVLLAHAVLAVAMLGTTWQGLLHVAITGGAGAFMLVSDLVYRLGVHAMTRKDVVPERRRGGR